MQYVCDNKRHLVCVPYSIDNLHKMASDLNIGKWRFHNNHYDIPKSRIAEIQARCLIVDSKTIVKIINHENNQ